MISLSKNYVGNAFPIQLADVADPHPRLTYVSFTQSMLQDTLSIRLGRLTINSVADEEELNIFVTNVPTYATGLLGSVGLRASAETLPGRAASRSDSRRRMVATS